MAAKRKQKKVEESPIESEQKAETPKNSARKGNDPQPPPPGKI